MDGFVGVHIGAGHHSEARTPLYLSVCASACKVAVDLLNKGGSALEAACAATAVLEDAAETNAGYGSNLTELGTVEMDAGIMDGESLLFGAVGAVPGVKNPILVAKMLVDEQRKGYLPLGRVPPGFLVGEGARDWARRHGVPTVEESSLIGEKASKLYRHYKKKLDAVRHQMSQKRALGPPVGDIAPKKRQHDLDDGVNDTVGVVVLDKTGRVASSVSSGGIALKQPGRVGQASCFGCGCWAQQGKHSPGKFNEYTVGVSTTGCGEHLVRTFLARECALRLRSSAHPLSALQDVMKAKFTESDFLAGVHEKLGGAICLHYDAYCGRGQFLWTHTTASMGLAYQTTSQAAPSTVMSRLGKTVGPNPPNGGTYILVQSVPFQTRPDEATNNVNVEVPKKSASNGHASVSVVPSVRA